MPTDTSNPFITTTDLATYLGRSVSSDGAALQAVDAACDFCRDIAEQQFNKVSGDVIRLDGTGTDALLLPQLPVSNAGTVEVLDSTTLPQTWRTMGTADYTLGTYTGTLYASNTAGTVACGSVWPAGRQNIRVTYDHGYTNVPTSVRGVALSIASRMFTQGPATSEVVGDVQVRYAAESTAVTPTERMILRKYRRTK